MVNPARCLIVAEAGVNHNGSVDMALRLIDAAAAAGADAVKFQTFDPEQLVARGAPKAQYQESRSDGEDQFSMLRGLQLPLECYPLLRDHCAERGVEFMSTPFDIDSARMLAALRVRRIKIASGEITNLPFLRELAELCLPMILSTGMATLDEVRDAVETIRAVWHATVTALPAEPALTLLHCTSNYPAQPADVNLRAMQTLASNFRLPVGYSDHTLGLNVALAAVALGARVIEKHYTLDRALPGPDHMASLEPDDLSRLVRDIREMEVVLGDGLKEPRPGELPVRDVVRRSAVLVKDIAAGDVVHDRDIRLLRPGTGIPPRYADRIPGRRLARTLPAGTVLQWSDFLP